MTSTTTTTTSLADLVAGVVASAATSLTGAQRGSLLDLVREFALGGTSEPAPQKVSVDPLRFLSALLRGVSPEEVSAASGVPLARITRGLHQLLQTTAGTSAETAGPASAVPTPAERTVVHYALEKRGREQPAPESTPETQDAPLATTPRLSIADCVATLHTEADRLAQGITDGGSAGEQLPALIDRLHSIATGLLRSAEFVAITDAAGQIVDANPEFRALLSTAARKAARADPNPDAADTKKRSLATVQNAWQATIAKINAGPITVSLPDASEVSPLWEGQRIALEDETTHTVRGYLNEFRSPGAPQLQPDVLQQLDTLLSNLSLYSSLFVHGSVERRGDYVHYVAELTTQLEAISGPIAGKSP